MNVIPFYVPPLRDRKEDIPLLVKEFLQEFEYAGGVEESDSEKARPQSFPPTSKVKGIVKTIKNRKTSEVVVRRIHIALGRA